MAKQKLQRELSLQQKSEVLLRIHKGESQRKLAKQYGMSKTTIVNIKKNEHSIIIQAMKANYRKSMLHSLLAAVRKFNTATEFAECVTVFDGIRWISSPWNNVREETILNCFWRAGFASPETDLQEQENSTSESDLVSALPEAPQFEVASEDILENEGNIPVHENIASTAEGILEDIMTGRV